MCRRPCLTQPLRALYKNARVAVTHKRRRQRWQRRQRLRVSTCGQFLRRWRACARFSRSRQPSLVVAHACSVVATAAAAAAAAAAATVAASRCVHSLAHFAAFTMLTCAGGRSDDVVFAQTSANARIIARSCRSSSRMSPRGHSMLTACARCGWRDAVARCNASCAQHSRRAGCQPAGRRHQAPTQQA